VTTRNQSSIDRYGEHSYQNDSVPLNDNTFAPLRQFAEQILVLSAYPSARLVGVTMRPAIDQRSYPKLLALGTGLALTAARVLWRPPDQPSATPYDVTARVIGWDQTITRAAWDMTLRFMAGFDISNTFHLGAHAQDVLDAGFVLARA
jgi:hypothetical protein